MGLIRAAKDSISSLLADQWREYFYCDTLPSDVLMRRGKKNNPNNNNKGNDNVISNGSHIAVNEGQFMIIVEQGAVVDFCAEAGVFVYDTSSQPSLLYGDLGENIKNTFKEAWERFTFAGNVGGDQRVYFINKKDIRGNLFGTSTPIDFHIVHKKSGYEYDTVLKCNGEYVFRISDPLMFYKNVCGNVKDEFTKDDEECQLLLNNMKREVVSKLTGALAPIAAKGVMPYEIGNYHEEICMNMQQQLSQIWEADRGIIMTSMTIVPNLSNDVRDELNRWNESMMYVSGSQTLDATMNQKAVQNREAINQFIGNSSLGGGANGGGTDPMSGMMGMMAMNMMGNMMGGNNMMPGNNMMGNNMMNNNMMNNAYAQQPVQQAPQMQAPVLGWTCECGKSDNRGKFCEECGKPKPAAAGWTCQCGSVNQGKFCQNCGTKKPEGAPLYKCDKCGWEPEDPAKPPKFCPECGDIFDDNDIR